MQFRSFKGTNISEVGLGTWQLGSADWGVVNDDEAFKILQAFVDLGGNFIGQGLDLVINTNITVPKTYTPLTRNIY